MALPTAISEAKHRATAAVTGAPRDAAGHRNANQRRPALQRGFTMAGLLVILTIIMIFIAYTVPRQWSKIMQREREKQTIYVMQQYARAIREWSKKNGGNPVKLDQLKEARLPRVLRGGPKGELLDPLTGKMDWIMVPPGAVTGPNQAPTNTSTTTATDTTATTSTTLTSPDTTGTTSTTGTSSSSSSSSGGVQFNAAASPKDYVGPFVGVRPPISGESLLSLNGANDYSQWHYTTQDLDLEIQLATALNPNAK